MVHGLDVVAIGIKYERGIVTGVVRTLARFAIVPSSGGDREGVKAVDLLARDRLERKVNSRRRRGASRRQTEFVGVHECRRELDELTPEYSKDCSVEPSALREI